MTVTTELADANSIYRILTQRWDDCDYRSFVLLKTQDFNLFKCVDDRQYNSATAAWRGHESLVVKYLRKFTFCSVTTKMR